MGHLITKPHAFQVEGSRGIYDFGGRAILADDPGLGKTYQSLYFVLKTPKHRPVVIVCPASLKWTWQTEASQHFNFRADVIEGRRPKRYMPKLSDLVIINYDILDSWLPCILRNQPATVIMDEIHYLRNTDSVRSRACKKLCFNAEARIGLSGTPLTNRPMELWSSLNVIRPEIFPSQSEYGWEFCKPKWTRWGWKFSGACNLKKLRRILFDRVMIRRLKKDVLPQLPPKVRKVISFRFAKKDQKEYEYAEDDFMSWLMETHAAKVRRAKRSPHLVRVGYLLRLVAKLKMPLTKLYLHEFQEANEGEKLVAMTMNTFVIDELTKEFPNSVVINGAVTGRARQEAVRQFQSNPDTQFLFANWRAGGVGLTLHAACNFLSLDFPWTPGDLLQGEDRIHRIGQKRKVFVRYLVVLDTIEEKLMKILQKNSNVLDQILNGEREDSDLDIFDDLIKQLKH